ncbi:MAG TPA: helix-turn-helix domain-containing protein [Bdellovibrionota bacterium]|nr:helix-turn-helix domain-containing protein [Bdellovibrionota bacterium]
MKGRQDHPAYQRAVGAYLAGRSRELARLRKARSLSADEKLLIEARVRLARRRFALAREALARVSARAGTFLHGDRCFLEASSWFQEGDFEASACWNLRARESYTAVSDRRGAFLSSHNLGVDFSRMGSRKLAAACFSEAEAAAGDPREHALLLRARACEESRSRRYAEAAAWLDALRKLEGALDDHDREVTAHVAADIYFRAGRAEDALRALEEAPPTARDLGRRQFERAMIAVSRKGGLLAPAPAPVRKAPEYLLKWELVRALQAGEQARGAALWKKLRAMSPGHFGGEFECLDASERDSSFWQVVRRLRKPAPKTAPALAGKLAKLARVLGESGFPLRKEELIERVWGIPYDPALDSRLYKLIERAKRQELPIVSRGRAYLLA